MYFTDLISNPLKVVEDLYAHFDLDLSKEAHTAIKHYVEEEAKNKHGHGNHDYSMSQFGLTEEAIDTAFKNYMQRYNIKRGNRK